MRKIQLLGLMLVAVLAFAAVAATSAMAELPNVAAASQDALWLVKGVAVPNGEELATETEGEIELQELGLGTILCSGIFDGVIYNALEGGLETGYGLVTAILDLGKVDRSSLTVAAEGVTCEPLPGSFCEKVTPSDLLIWGQNLPWLVTLLLMTLNNEELAGESFLTLFSADGFGNPAYEIDCLIIGILSEVLCEGETSSFLELVGTSLVGRFEAMDLELEELEGTCTNASGKVAVQNGSGTLKLVSGEELDPS